MGVGDQGPVVRQTGPLKGLAVTGEALTAGVELDRQVTDEADPPVAVGDQVGDTVVGAGAVGADDAVGGQARSGTVDEHDGQPRGAVGLEVGVVGADGRADQQEGDAAGRWEWSAPTDGTTSRMLTRRARNLSVRARSWSGSSAEEPMSRVSPRSRTVS